MTLTELPLNIRIGDTTLWTEGDSTYPAPTWTVQYFFTNKDSHFESVASVANGADHDIVINTAELEEGEYAYVRKVTDGSDTFTVEEGSVTVLPDLAADQAGVDRRGYAETALANIEAMLAGKASKDQTSYSLNGRALSRYSPDELREWRGSLRAEVRDLKDKARIKRGGKSHSHVSSRFSSAVN